MEENDYSLNIPRYVDTFEEEEPVDIDAVAAELKALETDMRKTDATIAGFVRSLGLAARSLRLRSGSGICPRPKLVP